jgi:hypothetical protein
VTKQCTIFPLIYQGEGQFTTPRGFAKRCDQTLVIGETLQWEQVNERSAASHKHYFSTISDAWANLPEALAADFPNPETLRKHALIKAGYCTVARVVCADNAGAIALCALMQAMDSYAICEVSGRVVTVYRAQSQSMRAMGKAVFQKSKDDVLTVISQIIGSDATQAGMSA